MSSQIPFKPLTPEALSRLTEDEQVSFTKALLCVAEDRIPPSSVLADLVEMVQRLITKDAARAAWIIATTYQRETLARLVRETWVATVRDLIPDPKPSWVAPYDELDEFQREADARIGEAVAGPLLAELEHAKSAAAGSHEGVRLWMLDCGNLVQKHRERAGAAEAKLAAIETHCRKRIEDTSHIRYLPADPWDVSVSAGAVLAIISTGETPGAASEEGTNNG